MIFTPQFLFPIWFLSNRACSEPIEFTKVIQTKYGQLRGSYKNISATGGRVAQYLGVPYATPPVGLNRFSPTRALSHWITKKDCITFKPACPQKLPDLSNQTALMETMSKVKAEYLKRATPLLKDQDEDCLYLNLYVPEKGKCSFKSWFENFFV